MSNRYAITSLMHRRVFPSLGILLLLSLVGISAEAGLFACVSAQSNTIPSGQDRPQNCPTCASAAPTQQIIYTPLIDLKESNLTEINLNCRSAHPIDVVPTFYTDDRTPVVGATIHLTPAEMRFVDVKSLIPAEHHGRQYGGGMTLSYTGLLMEVWAQMTFHGKDNSFNSFFAAFGAPSSNVRNAVWRTDTKGKATIIGAVTGTIGILDRFREIRDLIVASPGYTDAIGEDLMIVGAELSGEGPHGITPDLSPSLKVTVSTVYKVTIAASMQGMDAMRIEYKPNGASTWTTVAFFTKTPGEFTVVHQTHNQPESGHIRAIFLKKNEEAGTYSPEYLVTLS